MHDVFRSISSIFRDVEADAQARQAVVFAAWQKAAGPQLAAHAVPVKYENKRLTIAVSGVRWKQQMQDLAAQMVFRLNGAFGVSVLNFIDFVVDEPFVELELERRRVLAESHLLRLDDDAALPPEILAAASAIRDPKLRNDFLGAAGACIDRPAKLKQNS